MIAWPKADHNGHSGLKRVFNSLFRQEAAASRNERQQLDHLLRITAPHERIIVAGIALVLAGFVAWAFFGSIERGATFDGVLIEPGARHEIVSTEPGHIVELLISPGDRVAAGEPIARQTVPELDREEAALQERITLLETEFREAGGDGGALRTLLDQARSALLQMEARRAARASIVSASGGEIAALGVAPGDYLPASATVALLREADDGSPRAVLRVAPDMAQRIRPGMRASVEVEIPEGELRRFEGAVASVAAGPLPRWLAPLLPAAAEPGHRVDIALDEAPGPAVPDGTPCRVHIELGRDTPAALLAPGPS